MSIRLGISLLLGTLASLHAAQEPAVPAASAMPEVQALPDATCYGEIIIPDLRRLCDHIKTLTTTLSPSSSDPAPLDSLGALLNDPGLKNLGTSPVLALILPSVPTPAVVCILPTSTPKDYADAITGKGVSAKVVGNLVLFSSLPGAIDQALPLAQHYAALTTTSPASDIRLLISPARLCTGYGAMVKMLAATMLPMPPQQKTIITAELAGFLAIGGDLSEVQLDCSMDKGALQFASVSVAKPGSDLAKAMVSSVGQTPSAFSRLPNLPSLMTLSGHFNAGAAADYCASLIHGLASDPALQGLLTPPMSDAFVACMRSQTGDLGLQMIPKKGGWFLFNEIIGCKDPAALKAAQSTMMTILSAKGSLAQSMGSSTTKQDKVRTIGTVDVDRFTTVVDTSKLPPGSAKDAMAAMVTPMEMAASDGFLFISQDPASLDAMVTGKASGLSQKAPALFGPGMDCYWDLDLPSMAASLAILFLPDAAAKLPAASEVMSGCWRNDHGTCEMKVRLPVSTLSALSTIMMQAVGAGRVSPQGLAQPGEGASGKTKPAPPVF